MRTPSEVVLPHLYLCRHGQTDRNAEGRIQGQADTDINELGRQQAARNGRTLKALLGERVSEYRFIASPMRRTRETMQIVRRELGLDPDAFETDARLMELHFGDWQGSTLDEIAARDPQSIRDRDAGKWAYVPPGAAAESYAMLAKRASPVFEALTGPTILVAHGGIARIFLMRYGGLSPDEAAHASIAQDRFIEYSDGAVRWV